MQRPETLLTIGPSVCEFRGGHLRRSEGEKEEEGEAQTLQKCSHPNSSRINPKESKRLQLAVSPLSHVLLTEELQIFIDIFLSSLYLKHVLEE